MKNFIYQIKNECFILGGGNTKYVDKATAINNLSIKEKEVYESYQFKKKSSEFLTSRHYAKEVLSKVIPKESKDIEIEKGIFGHPVVRQSSNNLKISISHSAEYCFVLCFSELTPMGIDFESINLKNLNGIFSQMTTKEQNLIHRYINKSEEIDMVTIYWTLKEALSKSLMTGMYTSFKVFEISDIHQVTESNHIFKSNFTNFPQFKGISWRVKDTVFSIVIPKKAKFNIDIQFIYYELTQLIL